MSPVAELLVGLVVVVGLVGAVVQVYPGSLIVLGAVLVWCFVTGGTAGWVVGTVAVLVVGIAGVVKYVVAGRFLTRAGVPSSTLLVGGLLGIVGFFVVPVVGLALGFVLGVYLVELSRRREQAAAWRATVAALKATGLTILIELAGALLATGAWVIGLIVT